MKDNFFSYELKKPILAYRKEGNETKNFKCTTLYFAEHPCDFASRNLVIKIRSLLKSGMLKQYPLIREMERQAKEMENQAKEKLEQQGLQDTDGQKTEKKTEEVKVEEEKNKQEGNEGMMGIILFSDHNKIDSVISYFNQLILKVCFVDEEMKNNIRLGSLNEISPLDLEKIIAKYSAVFFSDYL